MKQPIKIQKKSPKLLSQLTRKRYNKTLETSVINSQMSPPSLLLIVTCLFLLLFRNALSALKKERLAGSTYYDDNDKMICLKLRYFFLF